MKSRKYNKSKVKFKNKTKGGGYLNAALKSSSQLTGALSGAASTGISSLTEKATGAAGSMKNSLSGAAGSMKDSLSGATGAASLLKGKAGNLLSGKASEFAMGLASSEKGLGGIGKELGKGVGDIGKKASGAVGKGLSTLANMTPIGIILKEIWLSLAWVVGNIIAFPIKQLDQSIPSNICKDYFGNPSVCNQSMTEFLFSGSKKDYGKLLDKGEKCLELDELNHLVKCKSKQLGGKPFKYDCRKKGNGNSNGNGNGNGSNTNKFNVGSKLKKLKSNLGLNFKSKSNSNSTVKKFKNNFIREQTLDYIKSTLLKINILLRQYECPKSKLKSIIKLITNKSK